MTDADRIVAHGMGHESAVEATAGVASPGHEEALADLAAENERLRAGMRVTARLCREAVGGCPLREHRCQNDFACNNMWCAHAYIQELDCWCKWAMAEADARKAGDAQ